MQSNDTVANRKSKANKRQRVENMWFSSFTLFIYIITCILATYGSSCSQLFCERLNLTDVIFYYDKCHIYKSETDTTVLGFEQHDRHGRKLSFEEWTFASNQLLQTHLPMDKNTQNVVREVKEAVFSFVMPRPFNSNIKLAAFSTDTVCNILDFDVTVTTTKEFLGFVSGNKILPDSKPLAHRYGGHQFGYWSGQLGDGRAHLLGEYMNMLGERWELQLKGSGKTPYSRRGDGYAVIRSSVREFLCSEAMHYLGVPTSRAATLVVTDDPVWRDQFYNGNVKQEKAAVVLRLAKSWFRYGSLEILANKNEINILKQLADFIIEHYFSHVDNSDPDKYLSFFSNVVESTAELIAKWQSVGFAHGVCNTDNFSILSITIDYGPFGFLDEYNPGFVPNTSDDEERYSYEKQPDVAYFNLNKLRLALNPLLNENQKEVMNLILAGYSDIYKQKFMDIFRAKLGLSGASDDDEEIVAYLLHMMEQTKADFTMTFRDLGDWPFKDMVKNHVSDDLWSLKMVSQNSHFNYWRNLLISRLKQTDISEISRRQKMQQVNPRYILRNWIAEAAIRDTEKGKYEKLNKIHEILKRPFEIQEEAEKLGFAATPPEWSKSLKVSCSS